MPMSKPIQCSDAGVPISTENLFLREAGMEAFSVETSKSLTEELYQPLETEEKSNFSLDCDIQLPPNKDQSQLLANHGDQPGLATYLPNTDISLDEAEINGNFALFIERYAPTFSKVTGVEDKSIPAISAINILPMHLYPTRLSNTDEELCFLQSKDISKATAGKPEINHFFGVKGPDKVSQNIS